jgi:NADH-quinone oxidoreductase subunit C
MSVGAAEILDAIRAAMPGASVRLLTNPGPSGQHSLLVSNDDLVGIMGFLRDHHAFDFLSNVTGVDWPDPKKAEAVAKPAEGEGTSGEAGFLETVYHLYSTTTRSGPLVVRARTADRAENATIPSVVSVFRSAEFQEREIFDLFGITFSGHPDLRRILMWDEFTDHPMRKDYVPPDDYEYEPTPHDDVLEKAKVHYPAKETQDFKTQDPREEPAG